MAEFQINPNGRAPNTTGMVTITGNPQGANIVDFKINDDFEHVNALSKISEDGVTTSTVQTGTVTSVVDCSGVVGFNVAGPALAEGDVFYVDGAGEPWDGGYKVINIFGGTLCTQVPFSTCYAGTPGGNILEPVGNYESTEGGVIYMADDWCETPLGVINTEGARVSKGYTNRMYTDCWECFTGTVDKCDITTTQVTLWDDDAIGSQNVTYCDGNKTFTNNMQPPGSDNPAGQNNP